MLLSEITNVQPNIVFQGDLVMGRDGSAVVTLDNGRKLHYAIAPKEFAEVGRLPGRALPIVFNARNEQGMQPYNVYVPTKRR